MAGPSRIAWVVVGVFGLAALICVRLIHLQVVQRETLRARADSQHQREVEVSATRGSILDRNGREIAASLRTEALYAHPTRVAHPEQLARRLAPIVGSKPAPILEKLRSGKPFVYLDRFLEPEQVRAFRELDLPEEERGSLGLLPSSRRYYPGGPLAVHVAGFVGIDGAGIEGIERRFDEELRGEPTVYLVFQDAHSESLSQQVVQAPLRRPFDVILTLDLTLQHFVERELDAAMQQTRARAASAVFLDPASGQVLALANRPAADANQYGQSDAASRIDRALVHQYEPGSTFKIVPMAAALEHRLVRPDEGFDCEDGRLAIGARRIRDSSPHGWLTAQEIIEKSSNIGMVKIAQRVPPRIFFDMIEAFGFGRRTGIELPEQTGSLRALKEWTSHSQPSLAFGHEIGVTVLQMASALSVIANDGVRVPPRLVLGLRDPEGHLRRFHRPASERVIPSHVARELASMLEGVVTEGTGQEAQLAGYRLAGKTGTAQKLVQGKYSEAEFMSSFGGFGPVEAPVIVGLVVLDSPVGDRHHGGSVAAPVFRRIMESALGYLRVPGAAETLRATSAPDEEASRLARNRERNEIGPGHVPDTLGLGLREAMSRLRASGYRSRIEGSGIVVAQEPTPGEPFSPGEICRLRLADPLETGAAVPAAAPRQPGRSSIQ